MKTYSEPYLWAVMVKFSDKPWTLLADDCVNTRKKARVLQREIMADYDNSEAVKTRVVQLGAIY